MGNINFSDFRRFIDGHIKEVDALNVESHSVEWFLLKYLRRIEKNAREAASPDRMDNSIRALVRFYVDALEDGSPLSQRCLEIYDEYRNTVRSAKSH